MPQQPVSMSLGSKLALLATWVGWPSSTITWHNVSQCSLRLDDLSESFVFSFKHTELSSDVVLTMSVQISSVQILSSLDSASDLLSSLKICWIDQQYVLGPFL